MWKNPSLKGPRSDSSLPLPWQFDPDVRRRWLPGSMGSNWLQHGATVGPPLWCTKYNEDLPTASWLHAPKILNLIVSGAILRKKSRHVVLSWCVLPALDPAISSIVAKVVPAAVSRSSVFATQMPWLPCYVCGCKVVHLWTCLGGPSWEEGWHGYHGRRLTMADDYLCFWLWNVESMYLMNQQYLF